MPRASEKLHMVLAVPMNWQEPQVREQVVVSCWSSCSVALPWVYRPKASEIVVVLLRAFSRKGGEESIAPPGTNMAGTSSRAAAMSIPGTILSQLPSIIRPSKRWARLWISMASAMLSREGRQ